MNEFIRTIWKANREDRYVMVVANADGIAYVRTCSALGVIATKGDGSQVSSRSVRMSGNKLPGYRKV